MSFEDSRFAGNVIKVLAKPAVAKINMVYGVRAIKNQYYTQISKKINDDKIKCVVDKTQIPSGAAAAYDSKANTIFGRDADQLYNDDEETVVHECTHAIFDMLKGETKDGNKVAMRVLEDELMANLAGAMYLALSQLQTSASSNSIRGIALSIVKAKGVSGTTNTATSPIEFTEDDVKALAAAIKKDKLYSNWAQKAPHDGVPDSTP